MEILNVKGNLYGWIFRVKTYEIIITILAFLSEKDSSQKYPKQV